MGCAGLLYGFICTYALARLLPKCRIMGVSNDALFFRENSSNISVIFVILFGVFGSMVPVLICNAIAMLCSAILMPTNEELTRKYLIKYLQNHEKAMSLNKPKNAVFQENTQSDDIIVVNVEKYKKNNSSVKRSVKKTNKEGVKKDGRKN